MGDKRGTSKVQYSTAVPLNPLAVGDTIAHSLDNNFWKASE